MPIQIDLKYATQDNILGRAVYHPKAQAYLLQPAAQALHRVAQMLAPQGFGLWIYDAYRPWSVTKTFWDSVSVSERDYFADPDQGSMHNRGLAVDLSLFFLNSGQEVEMPSLFDETTPRAWHNYEDCSDQAKRHRKTLKSAMIGQGFVPVPNEWWHYNFKTEVIAPILNYDFPEVSGILTAL